VTVDGLTVFFTYFPYNLTVTVNAVTVFIYGLPVLFDNCLMVITKITEHIILICVVICTLLLLLVIFHLILVAVTQLPM